jgi:hypothetical protein
MIVEIQDEPSEVREKDAVDRLVPHQRAQMVILEFRFLKGHLARDSHLSLCFGCESSPVVQFDFKQSYGPINEALSEVLEWVEHSKELDLADFRTLVKTFLNSSEVKIRV